ncbi:MAG: hypothetical protein ACJAS1_003445 [Oleiphilaceae bacterium]|jgi:hypothetical protein
MSKFVCAHCGKSSATASNVAQGSCNRSPTRKHKVIGEQAKYTCAYCAKNGTHPPNVVNGSCQKGPSKCHELIG